MSRRFGGIMRQIRLGNLKIDDLGVREAVDLALREGDGPCWVVTPNALMLQRCREDPATAALLSRASLSLADGVGVVLAARRQGTPLSAGRVAGIEFGEALLSSAADKGLRVFLLGGEEGIAERAARRLCRRYPTLSVCGTYWGYFDPEGEDDRRLVSVLRAVRPDVLLVCMGFPLQETWIAEHLDRLCDVRVIAGLGGSLDVWAGKCRRAPRALSRWGLEWAWRMLLEPRRLRQLPELWRFYRQK